MISFNTFEKEESTTLDQLSLSKAYHMMKEKGNTEPYDLFLPLDSIGEIVAETLFLNRYEINVITISYLELWYLEQSNVSVPLYSLNMRFEDRFQPIVTNVTYELYFQFICVFVFLDLSKIVSLLLRMDKIFSHLFISRQQLNHFFQTYHLSSDDYKDIISEITEANLNAPEDSYSIKKLISYFEKHRKFIDFIADFRNSCIKIGLNYEMYKTIKNKIDYYYHENSSMKKEESCINKMMRVLFSSQPEPYRYDYNVIDPNQASFNGLLRVVVKRFGAEVDRRGSSISARSISKNSMRRASNGSDLQRKTIKGSIKVTQNVRCSINLPGSPLPNNSPCSFASSPIHRYKKLENRPSLQKSKKSLLKNEVVI